MKTSLIAFLLGTLITSTYSDCYLQHPPGQNDRARERNDNRQNANRLYDSQNNAKGGYPWPGDATSSTEDCMIVYAGSKLAIDWTVQHSCGPNSNALCSVIVQYGMDTPDSMPNLREAMPQGNLVASDNNNAGYLRGDFVSDQQNDDATNTIPVPNSINKNPRFTNAANNDKANYDKIYAGSTESVNGVYGAEFSYHESFEYYERGYNTMRNKGLYTADQKLDNDRSVNTRQNPNGARSGLEIPEERDYYPWWNPSPWVDIAVFTSDTSWCEYYKTHSQNVEERFQCEGVDLADGLIPINEQECLARTGGRWVRTAPWSELYDGIEAPECDFHPVSRDNHLGNTGLVDENGNTIESTEPDIASYIWTIPDHLVGKKFTIRVRYNMSSNNYPSMNTFGDGYEDTAENPFVDARFNCPEITIGNDGDVDGITYSGPDADAQCSDKLTLDTFPLYNRPYVSVFENTPLLGLAINTNQIGRTFQDRSYCIRGEAVPEDSDCATIYNLNVRGRRGNIVQTYPATEYNFVPSNLVLSENDCAHIQFMGTDFNANKNPNNGEGWRYSSRSNIVEYTTHQAEFPKVGGGMFKDVDTAKKMAFVDQDLSTCVNYKQGDDNENNAIENCGKLNRAPAHFNAGLVKFNAGQYSYGSTRNNNFSNRSHKGTLVVNSGGIFGNALGGLAGTIVLVVSIVAMAGLAIGGAVFYGKRRPDSAVGRLMNRGGSGGEANQNFFY